MTTSGRSRAGRPARISRAQVLAAAMGLADRDGLDAVTMRRLGELVGVEAMSLYRHVQGKDDVLDGVVDLVFAEIDLPPAGPDWRSALRRRTVSAREVLVRHPWAVVLMEARTSPGPANMRHHDAVLGLLSDAGFTTLAAVRAYNIVNSFLYGFVLQEVALPVRNLGEQAEVSQELVARFATGDYPHLAATAVELSRAGFVYADEFEAGLDLILSTLHAGASPQQVLG